MLAFFLLAAASTLEIGERLYQQNRFEQALEVFEKIVRANQGSERGRLLLGYTQLSLGRNEQAIRTLEPLERRMGNDEEFLFSLSEAYTRESRFLATRIAELGESSARSHQLLAFRYQAEGDARLAEAEYRRAIQVRPTSADLLSEFGNYLWTQQRYDEAAELLKRALQVQPHDFMANLRYGQYLLRKNDSKSAQSPLQIAARHRQFSEAFLLLAYAMQKCGDPRSAAAVVAAGLTVFPKDSGLAEMSSKVGSATPPWKFEPLSETPTDVEKLRSRVELNPQDEDALFFLSQHYSNRGQLTADTLARVAPDSYRNLQLEAAAAEYKGDLASAEQMYRRVVEQKPRLHGAHYALGIVLARLGREQEAEAQFRSELAIDPIHPLAHYQLGVGALKRGDAQAARLSLQRAVEFRPEFTFAQLELARAMLQAGDASAAVPLLHTVVHREPEHSSAHFLLYRAYQRVGKPAEAARELAIHKQLLAKRNAAHPSGMK